MGLQLITGAAALLAAEDVRLHCSIDESDLGFDALLNDYIAAASGLIEEITGRAFGAQTWELALDAFPEEITVPRGPLTGVTSITYFDAAGAVQTLDASAYIADLISDPARIVPAVGTSWPATQARPNAVKVRFVTGYAALPPTIRQCIVATVAAWFATREAIKLPPGVEDALGPWRSQWVFA